MRPILPLTALSLLIAGSAAFASPMQDFETALRASYGDYRMALFATNSGDATKSGKALDALAASWSGLNANFGTAPPPQYQDDTAWAQTLAAVQSTIEVAKADVAAGALPKAHEALEAVRAEIGSLHERNGVTGFSDRMNAYHAEMEVVIGLDLAATDNVTLAEHAGVLTYLAAEIVRLPAPEATTSPDYAKLQAAFLASVKAYDDAVRAGDVAAVKSAIGGLKVPYSKFFLFFG